MILDNILSSITWTATGLQCSSYDEMKQAHKFLREAVMDRHIPIYKIIGVTITSMASRSISVGTQIARHPQIGESYAELTGNLADKVFLKVNNKTLQAAVSTGVNTLKDTAFKAYDKEAQCFYSDPKLCQVVEGDFGLKVAVLRDTGYRSMADNSKELKDQFFPCNTDFSLNAFVRILPVVEGTFLPIRYYNGFDGGVFRQLLSEWNDEIKLGLIKEDDKEWVSNFVI